LYKDYDYIWSINNNNVIPNKYKKYDNVIFIKRNTDAYYKYLSSAKILINNVTFPSFFTRKLNQKYLNTWHGTTYKKLGYDVKEEKLNFINTARNFLQSTHLILPNNYSFYHQLIPYN